LAEIQLQRDPSDVEVKGILSDSQRKLVEVFQNSVERNRHLSASKWLKYGDTCSKAFFDFSPHKEKENLLARAGNQDG
jgi:hypothetical protein